MARGETLNARGGQKPPQATTLTRWGKTGVENNALTSARAWLEYVTLALPPTVSRKSVVHNAPRIVVSP